MTTEFWAIVGKVQTMADGGIRVTLDMGEDSIVQMAELAAYKINGIVIDVTCEPRQKDERDYPEQSRKIHI